MASLWTSIGIILLFSVIGFPLAMRCFRIAWLTYKPFGKDVVLIVDRPIVSALWLVSIGWILGCVCIANALLSCATILGLPLVKQWIKICRLAFFPFFSIWK